MRGRAQYTPIVDGDGSSTYYQPKLISLKGRRGDACAGTKDETIGASRLTIME